MIWAASLETVLHYFCSRLYCTIFSLLLMCCPCHLIKTKVKMDCDRRLRDLGPEYLNLESAPSIPFHSYPTLTYCILKLNNSSKLFFCGDEILFILGPPQVPYSPGIYLLVDRITYPSDANVEIRHRLYTCLESQEIQID